MYIPRHWEFGSGLEKLRNFGAEGVHIYTTLKFLALQGAPYIYNISRLQVKVVDFRIITRRVSEEFAASKPSSWRTQHAILLP
jgi:hypothetical protein